MSMYSLALNSSILKWITGRHWIWLNNQTLYKFIWSWTAMHNRKALNLAKQNISRCLVVSFFFQNWCSSIQPVLLHAHRVHEAKSWSQFTRIEGKLQAREALKSRQKSFTSLSQHCNWNLRPQRRQLHITHTRTSHPGTHSSSSVSQGSLIHTKLGRKRGEESKDEGKGEAIALQASLKVANGGKKGGKKNGKN